MLDVCYYLKYDIYFLYFEKINVGQDLIEVEKALFVYAISYALDLYTHLSTDYILFIVLNYYIIYIYHKLN